MAPRGAAVTGSRHYTGAVGRLSNRTMTAKVLAANELATGRVPWRHGLRLVRPGFAPCRYVSETV